MEQFIAKNQTNKQVGEGSTPEHQTTKQIINQPT
jgi:hypothetical protein